MPPARSAARRLSTLGCVLAGAGTLALSGCGSGGDATAESTAAPSPKPQAKAETAGKRCPAQVNAFVKSLDTLRRRLAIGLSYEQYAAAVKDLRAGHDEIPVDRLTIGCLATTGTPSEQALNKYIDAANAWGECLADAACTTSSIETVLQRKWRVASRLLSKGQ